MDEKKLLEIFADEAFVQSLFKLGTIQEALDALKGRGLMLSLEEFQAILRQILLQYGELSEDDLDSISGGLQVNPVPGIPRIPKFPFPFDPAVIRFNL